MGRKIEVVSSKPEWPQRFQQEKKQLQKIFQNHCLAIHHIGSTAIKGIKAKPTIDILIEVPQLTAISSLNETMNRSGYEFFGETGIEGGLFFVKGGAVHAVHVHILQAGHPEIQRHLVFKEYLNVHPTIAQQYSQLKEELAEKFPTDPQAYCEGKTSLIATIDQQAWHWSTTLRPRPATEKDTKQLIALWEDSVKTTHDFLTAEDLIQIKKELPMYFAAVEVTLWFLGNQFVGFSGMDLSANKLEMLFLAPQYIRLGHGKQIILSLIESKGLAFVDVNEQNHQAAKFYQSMGFYPYARSQKDSAGRNYPILYLKR